MKKDTKATRAPQRSRTAPLTEKDLAAVRGGNEGAIIVENGLPPSPQGIQGSG